MSENRLLTMIEILVRFPKAFFNRQGELIYNKSKNYYILPSRFHELGKKSKRAGWNQDIWLLPEKHSGLEVGDD